MLNMVTQKARLIATQNATSKHSTISSCDNANSEFFARVYGKITLSFTDEGKSCHSHKFYVTNMSFNAIRYNKILAEISEFTVYSKFICFLFFFP